MLASTEGQTRRRLKQPPKKTRPRLGVISDQVINGKRVRVISAEHGLCGLREIDVDGVRYSINDNAKIITVDGKQILERELQHWRGRSWVSEIVRTPLEDPMAWAPMPKLSPLLDRSTWTEEQWEAHRQAWRKLDAENLQRRVISDHEIFRKVHRHKQIKKLRQHRRLERQAIKAQRKQNKEQKAEERARVFAALGHGRETTGQIAKALKMETRLVRQAIRHFIKKGEVVKISGRRYVTKTKYDENGLADQPKKVKRKRLVPGKLKNTKQKRPRLKKPAAKQKRPKLKK